MALTNEEIVEFATNERDDIDFVIQELDHEINTLLEQRQAIMTKYVNPYVLQMDGVLNDLDVANYEGDFLYKHNWYKNLDLESWGIFRELETGDLETRNTNAIHVDNLDGIEVGSSLLIQLSNNTYANRVVSEIEYDVDHRRYVVIFTVDSGIWERKFQPDWEYPKCIDPYTPESCSALDPCTDPYYEPPYFDINNPDLIDTVRGSDRTLISVKEGYPPYQWSFFRDGEPEVLATYIVEDALPWDIDNWISYSSAITTSSVGWEFEQVVTEDGENYVLTENACSPITVRVDDFCNNFDEHYLDYTDDTFEIDAPTYLNRSSYIVLEIKNGGGPFYWDISEQSNVEQCSDGKCCELLFNGYLPKRLGIQR